MDTVRLRPSAASLSKQKRTVMLAVMLAVGFCEAFLRSLTTERRTRCIPDGGHCIAWRYPESWQCEMSNASRLSLNLAVMPLLLRCYDSLQAPPSDHATDDKQTSSLTTAWREEDDPMSVTPGRRNVREGTLAATPRLPLLKLQGAP